jgi:two-component system sensor histidine kinase SenX3
MWWLVVLGLAIGGAVGVVIGRRLGSEPPSSPVVNESPGQSDSERRLLRIVEALPLGVLVFDASGRQLFANGAATRFSEDRLHDVLVMSAIEEVVAEASASPDLASLRMLDLYGPTRTHLAIRGVPVGAGVVGRAAVVVTVEDVTELRRADLLRRDFVANVSHELKTPIGAISVLAETLLDVEDPLVGRRLASRLQNESLRLASTVDDLLTLARIESGERVDLTSVRIDDVLAAVAGRVGFVSEARSVELVVDIEPSDLQVIGDRTQLVSGLGNVVDNAIKYSGEATTVTVTARADADRATISVEDHGIGIPEADLERIFERFYRVDRGRGRETGGTGLGLSIVRHVLRNHGGTIDVTSTEGEGTTFVVTLPIDPAPSPALVSEPALPRGADVG